MPDTRPTTRPTTKPNSSRQHRLARVLLLGLITLGAVILWSTWQARTPTYGQSLPSNTPSFTQHIGTSTSATPVATSTASTPAAPVGTQMDYWIANSSKLQDSLVILAVEENGFSHLFAYLPGTTPFIRLTNGSWDDISPALNPDGATLVFSSNRSGWWDIYLLNLKSGDLTQVTDTPSYDGSPSWSPDGRWLTYESYQGEAGGLEIFVRSLDGAQEPIQLTADPGADFDPSWSPLGRQIAFVSTRSGENEIWLADLDRGDDRFTNASRNQQQAESHPTWSPDGSQLVWAATGKDGVSGLYVWSPNKSDHSTDQPRLIGGGSWPAWSPAGNAVFTLLSTPNQEYLTGYGQPEQEIVFPPIPLSGVAQGIYWGKLSPELTLAATFETSAQATIVPIWQPALTPMADVPAGRQRLVALRDVLAPNAVLQDLVDESFVSLRQRIAQSTGWDLMANLENAYVPLTIPLDPGLADDWLYTGRAFAFNPLPANAGWIVILREEYGAQTYWRVFLRTRYQDGSQGKPLKAIPWDINARANGDPRAYETGGAYMKNIPSGYWIDFTALAAAYNWERLPALNTWRSAYSAARFNEFFLSDGLDWRDAMLEIYPAEVLVTPTPIIPTPQSPTRTLRPSLTPTPTRTARPTSTATPSATPLPGISVTSTP